MSARILYSLTDQNSREGGGGGGAQKQPIGCMNGIFHIFDRGHFLSGGRRQSGIIRKRLATGQEGNCDAEEDTISIKSTVEGSKAFSAKERHRMSADSSRSSASSSCNSSGFSSIEDNRERRAKDLPRLKQRWNNMKNLGGENHVPRSGAMTYVDSPRPVLPSSTSLGDFTSRARNFADSSPRRFSYDGRELRDSIKSNATKLREQPRHSLDSKKSSLSSVVAKLMGLEAAADSHARSNPETVHGRNDSADEHRHELRGDLVVRLKSNASQESPLQSPSISVYGELEKSLEQVEFKRSGKDLRALKQILEAMQKSNRLEDCGKNIRQVVTETINVGRSDFTAEFPDRRSMKPAGSVNTRDALPPRSSSRCARYANRSSESTTHMTDDRGRRIVESDYTGRNHSNSRARQRPKKPELTDSIRRSNQTRRQLREPASPCRNPKSKVSDHSRKPSKHSNAVSLHSDEDTSLASRDDDSEVSSYHIALLPKVLRPSEVNHDSPLGIIQVEQPSPVSVLDPTYSADDELLSPVKMTSEDFKDDKPSNNLLMGQSEPKRSERIQRKLLFDIIDEIMVQKLVSDNNKNHRFSPCSPGAKKTGQEQLLQGLCSEIAWLRADNYKGDTDDEDGDGDYIRAILRRDMERESQGWNGRWDDSGVMLDIERLIFKDLVTEVVTGEAAAGLRKGRTSYCRPTMSFV